MVSVVITEIKKKEVIMPRGDRTGPRGEGPRTGRQMGFCVGNEHPGYVYRNMNQGPGFGRQFRGRFGGGRGPGFGFMHSQGRFQHSVSWDVSEKTLVENEIRILKDQLSALENRLSEFEED